MELSKLPALCTHHSGADPIWHGKPSRSVSRYINKVTYKEEDSGKLYYISEKCGGRMIPLVSVENYEELNLMIATFTSK